jgi:alpha-mannosidase
MGSLTSGKATGIRQETPRVINDLGPAEGTLEVENAGPVSVTLKATVAPLARTTRITLYHDLDRIDIDNEITQNFGDTPSGLSVSTSTRRRSGTRRWAILKAKLFADGGYYSPVMSRLDWLSLNHFAAMSDASGAGVTLSNADCAFMKPGASAIVKGALLTDTQTPQISAALAARSTGRSWASRDRAATLTSSSVSLLPRISASTPLRR